MHFHFCGDIVHDVVHNLVILLNMAPDWVPLMAHMKGWLKEKSHGRTETTAHGCERHEQEGP